MPYRNQTRRRRNRTSIRAGRKYDPLSTIVQAAAPLHVPLPPHSSSGSVPAMITPH
ncbi:MAG: hypothetical protein IPM54_32210 [Polyangiaceae bacterium]|nr:hypothetical protein [Polyangiaceae bacterium]